jgi:hypothetical protein
MLTRRRVVAVLISAGWVSTGTLSVAETVGTTSVGPIFALALVATSTATICQYAVALHQATVRSVTTAVETTEAAITEVTAPVFYEQGRRHSRPGGDQTAVGESVPMRLRLVSQYRPPRR